MTSPSAHTPMIRGFAGPRHAGRTALVLAGAAAAAVVATQATGGNLSEPPGRAGVSNIAGQATPVTLAQLIRNTSRIYTAQAFRTGRVHTDKGQATVQVLFQEADGGISFNAVPQGEQFFADVPVNVDTDGGWSLVGAQGRRFEMLPSARLVLFVNKNGQVVSMVDIDGDSPKFVGGQLVPPLLGSTAEFEDAALRSAQELHRPQQVPNPLD